MKKLILSGLILTIFTALVMTTTRANSPDNEPLKDTINVITKDKLVVVWTSGDKEVAMKMVFMYTYNARKYGWWDDITLLVWGPSSKLLSDDKELQEYVRKMLNEGIEVLACKACADMYEVADDLSQIGVTVRYTGEDLTNFIKERHVVTF